MNGYPQDAQIGELSHRPPKKWIAPVLLFYAGITPHIDMEIADLAPKNWREPVEERKEGVVELESELRS